MYRTEENPPIYKWKLFDKYSHIVNTGMTCRTGGISNGEFSSFNQALHCNDQIESVLANRTILCNSQNISFEKYTCAEQTHSAGISFIDKESCGSGRDRYSDSIKNTDALIISDKNIMINIHIADCVPLVLFDTDKRVGALIHAGWKGTAQLITLKTVKYMISRLQCNPNQIIAGIGPSIDSCCFKIGEDTAKTLKKSFNYSPAIIRNDNETIRADLKKANCEQLISSGLNRANIEISGICTCCSHDIFYSYRAEKGLTGRAAVYMIFK